MRRWLVFGLLFGVMVFPFTVGAQGGTKLDALNIELWSEYDQPSMLVINQFVVSQDTSLPASVTLRFPKDGNLVAVAVEKNGEFFNKDFTPPAEQGNWQTVTINVDSYDPHRIEYYQPLTRDGNKRAFKYQWFGDYSVKQFDVTIFVPADGTELITSPVLQSTSTSKNGLLTSGTVTKNEMKMGGGFGLALIVIALFSYWRSTQSSEEKPQRRRHPQNEAESEEQAYCHECGARAHAGDRFCRTCGSRLRIE